MDVKTVEKAAPEDKGNDGKPRRRSKWGALLVADKQQKSNVSTEHRRIIIIKELS
jgi:hypothetical protein